MQFPEKIQSGSDSNKMSGGLQMQKLRAVTFTYLQKIIKKIQHVPLFSNICHNYGSNTNQCAVSVSRLTCPKMQKKRHSSF